MTRSFSKQYDGYHRNRRGYGIKGGESCYHLKTNGTRPGKAGDSGGAYLIERYCDYSHVMFSVLHGGGYGPQVAPLKKWIDNLYDPDGIRKGVSGQDLHRCYLRRGSNGVDRGVIHCRT